MALYRKALAKQVKDTPWFVRDKIPLDAYSPTIIHQKRTFVENITYKEKITGKDARIKGIEIDHWTRDDEVLNLEWTEAVPQVEHWTELFLRPRQQESGKVKMIRSELYEAAKDPLNFLPHKRLMELVKNEIEHWKSHDMNRQKINPLVVAFMDFNDEDENEGVAFVRDVFYIKTFGDRTMVVSNSSDQTFEIVFEEGIVKAGIVRRFILFLPSNIKLIDPETNKVLL